jgi:calcineurin-like phosphoesterase family protein
MIWFTSDAHYWHKNIAGPKVSQWKSGYRNFENEREMSRYLVDQINKYVKKDDTLYYLGDWSFGGIQNIWNFRKQINCKEIHLILGNHDGHIRQNKLLPNCSRWGKDINNITDIPSDNKEYYNVYAKDLFETVQDVLELKENKHKFFLSHYAHRVWDKSHHGVIHLYGHSHGTIDDFGKSMDVGIDNIFKLTGEYKPISILEIIDIMNKKEIKIIDHHNFKTND